MSFYRAPINPGWDDFGARIQQGVQTGIALAVDGRQRRRDRARQDEADRIAAAARDRQQTLENAEIGVVPEGDAYETVRAPSLADAAAGASPFVPDWATPAGTPWRGETRDMDGVDPRALGAFAAAPQGSAPAMERRLRPGVVQAGGLFIDPTRSLAFRRQRAQVAAEHAQSEADRGRKRDEVRAALVASGMEPEEADRRGVAAAYGVTLPETPAERAERIRMDESAREPFRQADDDRSLQRALALRAASGGGGGGGGGAGRGAPGGTPSQQRAARNEARAQVEDTAYRLIRSDPTISEQELFDAMKDYRGEVSASDILNGISSAQSRYGRERGGGQMGQIQERGRASQAARRQAAAASRRAGPSGAPSPARPAPSGNARPTITQAEATALKGQGYTDQQIREKYTIRAR